MAAERFPVEAGQILLFARALGDENRIYADPEYARGSEPGGVIAPPTFSVSSAHFDPEYDRRPQPGVRWFGSGREAVGASEGVFNSEGGSGFHAEQRFIYHRPLRAGETLGVETREGERWQKQGRRGGVLTFSETITEFRDEAGELVLTSIEVGVGTEKAV